jgi:hypothetical protein
MCNANRRSICHGGRIYRAICDSVLRDEAIPNPEEMQEM